MELSTSSASEGESRVFCSVFSDQPTSIDPQIFARDLFLDSVFEHVYWIFISRISIKVTFDQSQSFEPFDDQVKEKW